MMSKADYVGTRGDAHLPKGEEEMLILKFHYLWEHDEATSFPCLSCSYQPPPKRTCLKDRRRKGQDSPREVRNKYKSVFEVCPR